MPSDRPVHPLRPLCPGPARPGAALRRPPSPRRGRSFSGAAGSTLLVVLSLITTQTPTMELVVTERATTESIRQEIASIPQALAAFNRGCALIEQYRYEEAALTFEAVTDFAPDWTAARFNAGLAWFNLQGSLGAQDYLERARSIFEAILEKEPDHLRARFSLGMYWEHLGRNDESLEQFERVYKTDPTDQYGAYKYAEALIRMERDDEAIALLETLLEQNPGFVSACYRLAILYQKTRQREKAMPLFDRFRSLNQEELTGGSFTVQKTYGTAGALYMALGPDDLPLQTPRTPETTVVFSPEIVTLGEALDTASWSDGAITLPGLTAGDLDGAGHLDVIVTGADAQGAARVWRNAGSGDFEPGQTFGARVVMVAPGDVDNNETLDLVAATLDGPALFRNDGQGRLERTTTPPLVIAPGARTLTIGALDIDSDGDLDILALNRLSGGLPAGSENRPTSSSLFNNNRDGEFPDLAAQLGLALPDRTFSSFVFDDFDDDRDLDLILFPADDGPAVAWVNDRGGAWRALGPEHTGLSVGRTWSATSGDPFKTGRRDLLVFTTDGVRLFRNAGGFRFREDATFPKVPAMAGATGGQLVDIDNDGDLDILIADGLRNGGGRAPLLLINHWPDRTFTPVDRSAPGQVFAALDDEGPISALAADFTGDGRCDIVLAAHGRPLRLIRNITPDAGGWLGLDLKGTREQDNKARSNTSAIGARVEIKTGGVMQQFVVGGSAGPATVAPLRLHAGLGAMTSVEWLRVLWPDSVLQAELEVPGGQVMALEELSRKIASCPLLFAWDGERMGFVADFAGVGGLGFLVAPGVYGMPVMVEYLPLPNLKARDDGHYDIRIVDYFEEVVYLDEIKLLVVDHPAGTTIVPNARMSVSLPPPHFEIFQFQEILEVRGALDHQGQHVAGALRELDRRCVGATDPDPRFPGLADPHWVELDFRDGLNGLKTGDRPILVLHGWVEYGYSATNYALSQTDLRLEAPSIFVWRNAQWTPLIVEAGYPAGVNHLATFDLSDLVTPSDRLFRIETNMEIYWDQITIGIHRDDAPMRVQEIACSEAELRFLGFPREYSPDGRKPNIYDYENCDTAVPWKLFSGAFTRYGDVRELVQEADDCYVIMNHGDEVVLRFPAPPPTGWERSYILKSHTFAKDMDLYTAYPDTVEPLPFQAMSAYPYPDDEAYPDTEKTREYHRRYNTRIIGRP